MSRHKKVKYITPSPKVREVALWVYTSWNEAIEEHAGRNGQWIPTTLRNHTARIEEESLPAAICKWIEELGLEAAKETWQQLLANVPTSTFLKKGYENLIPNLCWLFEYSNKGRGLSRVLDGSFDKWERKGTWVDYNEGV